MTKVVDNLSAKSSIDRSYLARLTIALPFVVAPIVFLLDNQIIRIIDVFGFGTKLIPSFSFVSDQYDFLVSCKGVPNIFDALACKKNMSENLHLYDFQIFELFIWTSSALCLFRVIVGIFTLEKLDWYAKKINRSGVLGILGGYCLLGPLGIFASISFELASHSPQAHYLMERSPRAFLFLHTFIFGVSSAFSAEGVLFVLWTIFRRSHATAKLSNWTEGKIDSRD